jgi:hypothetical protein
MNYRCGRRLGQEIVRMFFPKIRASEASAGKGGIRKRKGKKCKKEFKLF